MFYECNGSFSRAHCTIPPQYCNLSLKKILMIQKILVWKYPESLYFMTIIDHFPRSLHIVPAHLNITICHSGHITVTYILKAFFIENTLCFIIIIMAHDKHILMYTVYEAVVKHVFHLPGGDSVGEHGRSRRLQWRRHGKQWFGPPSRVLVWAASKTWKWRWVCSVWAYSAKSSHCSHKALSGWGNRKNSGTSSRYRTAQIP